MKTKGDTRHLSFIQTENSYSWPAKNNKPPMVLTLSPLKETRSAVYWSKQWPSQTFDPTVLNATVNSLYLNPNIELDIPVTVCVHNFASKHYSEFIMNLFATQVPLSTVELDCLIYLLKSILIRARAIGITTTVNYNRRIRKPDIIWNLNCKAFIFPGSMHSAVFTSCVQWSSSLRQHSQITVDTIVISWIFRSRFCPYHLE